MPTPSTATPSAPADLHHQHRQRDRDTDAGVITESRNEFSGSPYSSVLPRKLERLGEVHADHVERCLAAARRDDVETVATTRRRRARVRARCDAERRFVEPHTGGSRPRPRRRSAAWRSSPPNLARTLRIHGGACSLVGTRECRPARHRVAAPAHARTTAHADAPAHRRRSRRGVGTARRSPRSSSERDGLAQSSVYRNLVVLEEAGVVHRMMTRDEFARYELAEDLTEHHHHLVCSNCGRVDDLPATPAVEKSVASAVDQAARKAGFRTQHHRLDLIGLCRELLVSGDALRGKVAVVAGATARRRPRDRRRARRGGRDRHLHRPQQPHRSASPTTTAPRRSRRPPSSCTALGGTGIAVVVDHLDSGQVARPRRAHPARPRPHRRARQRHLGRRRC